MIVEWSLMLPDTLPPTRRSKNAAPAYSSISPHLCRIVLHDWNRFFARKEPIGAALRIRHSDNGQAHKVKSGLL
jgi:hypothetical protein